MKFESSTNYKNNISLYYVLETLYNFMKDGDVSKDRHEENLNISIIYDNFIDNKNSMTIFDISSLSSIDANLKMLTGDNFSGNNLIHYDDVFNINFIKNKGGFIVSLDNNYFVILVKLQQNLFSIRDCKQIYQYDFNSFDDLLIHLFNTYKINELDNKNIICIKSIYKKFECDINMITGIDIKPHYNIIENKKGYIDIDLTILNYDSDGEDSIFN